MVVQIAKMCSFATEVAKELLWMQKLLQELSLSQEKYVLYCHIQSAIHLSKNSTYHSKSKHTDVRYHWICDALEMKQFSLEKIHTNENGSNKMTNALPTEKLSTCRKKEGLITYDLP